MDHISQRAAKRYRRNWRQLWAWLRRAWNAQTPENSVYLGEVQLTEHISGRMVGATQAFKDAIVLARPCGGSRVELYAVKLEGLFPRG